MNGRVAADNAIIITIIIIWISKWEISMRWQPYQEKKLVSLVIEHQSGGISENAAITSAAKEMGIGYTSAYQKYFKIKSSNFSVVDDSRYPTFDNITFDGDALILCDLHMPLQNSAFINRCVAKALSLGVKRLVLGGDWLDLTSLSSWPEDFEKGAKQTISDAKYEELRVFADTLPQEQRSKLYETLADSVAEKSFSEEVISVRCDLKVLLSNFDEIIAMMGNHEKWAVKRLEKGINADDMQKLFLGDDAKIKVTNFYWLKFTSGGKEWMVEHPKNIAKGSSKRMAGKYTCNIVMAHNHQFSVQTDPSGRFVGIEPGMCADENRMGYASLIHGIADQHVTGAVIIKDGRAILINDFIA